MAVVSSIDSNPHGMFFKFMNNICSIMRQTSGQSMASSSAPVHTILICMVIRSYMCISQKASSWKSACTLPLSVCSWCELAWRFTNTVTVNIDNGQPFIARHNAINHNQFCSVHVYQSQVSTYHLLSWLKQSY